MTVVVVIGRVGELPHKVVVCKQRLRENDTNVANGGVLDNGDILLLKEVVNKNLNLYLDEQAFLFGIRSDKFVHHSTLRR